MTRINKKMNEIYISKKVTLIIPYRGKTREVAYCVTDIFGTAMQMTAKLKSIKYPCEIPNLSTVEIRLNNEFPTKSLLKKIKTKCQKLSNSL